MKTLEREFIYDFQSKQLALDDIKIEHELLLRQIAQSIRAVSRDAEINIRLLKRQNTHEVLLWGTVQELPLGIYSRGVALNQALLSSAKKVANFCVKARSVRAYRRPLTMQSHPFELSLADVAA